MRSTFLAVAVVGAVCSPLSANAQDLCGTPKPPVELGQIREDLKGAEYR